MKFQVVTAPSSSGLRILKMKTLWSSETSETIPPIQCYNPEELLCKVSLLHVNSK